jgi:predicted ArsR family transcriptional regulator
MTTYRGQNYIDFDAPAQAHSPTSVAAAAAQTPEKAGTQRARILEHLGRVGPCTDEEIGLALGLDLNAVRPRRVKLLDDGLVVTRGTGVTKSGKRAVKWGRAG